MRSIFSLGSLLMVLTISVALAERSGSFDITVQEVNDKDSQVISRGANYQSLQMTQNLKYKVRIDYKGIDKLKDVKIYYVFSFRPNQSKPKLVQGDQTLTEVSPLQKIEFSTLPAENSYHEYVDGGIRNRYGKSKLDGITIRIMAGKTLLTEWSKPTEAEKYWEDPSIKQDSPHPQ